MSRFASPVQHIIGQAIRVTLYPYAMSHRIFLLSPANAGGERAKDGA